jgi:hypothetical protein
MEDNNEHTAAPDEILSTRLIFQHGAVDAMLDTGDFSVWTTMEVFIKAGGEHFQADIRGARGVDGKPVDVLGDGIITFQLWGCRFRERARVMKAMAEPMILGCQFMRRHNFTLDVAGGRATFWKMVAGANVMIGGTIVAGSAPGLRSESIGAVADLDIKDEIDALEMDMDDEEAERHLRAVLRAHRAVFSGVGKAKSV